MKNKIRLASLAGVLVGIILASLFSYLSENKFKHNIVEIDQRYLFEYPANWIVFNNQSTKEVGIKSPKNENPATDFIINTGYAEIGVQFVDNENLKKFIPYKGSEGIVSFSGPLLIQLKGRQMFQIKWATDETCGIARYYKINPTTFVLFKMIYGGEKMSRNMKVFDSTVSSLKEI